MGVGSGADGDDVFESLETPGTAIRIFSTPVTFFSDRTIM
jgi:hypothetical protein